MSNGSGKRRSTTRFAPVRAIITIAREFDKVARDNELSIVHYRLLLYLKDGPRRAGEVAATSLVTKGTISGHILALREKGWITVETEPFDRRVVRLLRSDTGREAMENFEERLLQCLAGLVDEKDRDRNLRNLSDIYWALSATRETRYQDLESPDYKYLPPSGAK